MSGFQHALSVLEVDCRYNLRSSVQEIRRVSDESPLKRLKQERHPITDMLRSELLALSEEQVVVSAGKNRFRPVHWRRFHTWLNYACGQSLIDPWKVWLETLPTWDKKDRAEHLLSQMFGCEDSPYTGWGSLFLFLGSVQRTFDPACKLDELPILVGTQGIGKSTFLCLSLPDEFQEAYFTDSLRFGASDQQMVEALQGKERCLLLCRVQLL